MELNFAPKILQIPIPNVPHKACSLTSPVATRVGCTQPMALYQVHRPTIFVISRKFKECCPKLRPCARFNDFYDQGLSEDVDGSEIRPCDDDIKENNEKSVEMKIHALPSYFELLELHDLEINPEPPSWRDREEICRTLPWKKGSVKDAGENAYSAYSSVKGAGEYAYCSVKKAFSSLVFIITELHNQIWQIKENLHCEELQPILRTIRRDIYSMYVWLFQQVFSKTPTLMLYLALLLANFSVHSMDTQQKMFNQQAIASTTSVQEDEDKEELVGSDKVLEHQMQQNLVSPMHVKLEPAAIAKKHQIYQTLIDKDPDNPLPIVNYALFLYQYVNDNDRAEEWFKRAVELEPADADALGQYAEFLWLVRHDYRAADEKYKEAVAAEPESVSNYKAKHARLLWRSHDTFNMVS